MKIWLDMEDVLVSLDNLKAWNGRSNQWRTGVIRVENRCSSGDWLLCDSWCLDEDCLASLDKEGRPWT